MKLKLFLQWNPPSIKMRWLWLESPPYHYRLSAWTEFRMTWWCKTCRRLFEISTSNITFWHKTGNYNVKYLRLVQDIGDVNISKMCKLPTPFLFCGINETSTQMPKSRQSKESSQKFQSEANSQKLKRRSRWKNHVRRQIRHF